MERWREEGGLTGESRHVIVHARAGLSRHLAADVIGGEWQGSSGLCWGHLRGVLTNGDGGNMTSVESASGPAGFARWAGINGEGDTRDTIDTDGGGPRAGAELRHLGRIFAVGPDSSLIFAKCASRADSTEGEGRIAVPTATDSHAVSDGSRGAGSGDRLPVG